MSYPQHGLSFINICASCDDGSTGHKRSSLSKINTIAVVDDDDSVRKATSNLLHLLGYSAASFASAEDFLKSDRVREVSCLITDVTPGDPIRRPICCWYFCSCIFRLLYARSTGKFRGGVYSCYDEGPRHRGVSSKL
jgi:hypothetical protein